MFSALPTRPSLFIPDHPNIGVAESQRYSDSRTHGYQGPTRFVSIHNATSVGGGSVSIGPDSVRCVVAGRESLRILRVSEQSSSSTIHEHKFSIGSGGHQIEMSKNLWTGSGLKVESALTDVAWGQQTYDQKLVTSSRNGELILWDLNKAGPVKYERRIREHSRSINKLSYSRIHPYLCITGSADGDLRVWDLRHIQKSAMYIRHPDVIRTLVLSPCLSYSSQAVTGLDNGSIYRWDIRVGSKGLVDRLPVAHSGAILGMDWSNNDGTLSSWLATAGLDRSVKIWDMSSVNDPQPSILSPNSSHSAMKASHTLYTQFQIRRVLWRPDFQTELAISSFHEFGTGALGSSAAPTSFTESFLKNSPGSIDAIGDTSGSEVISGNIKAKDISHVKNSGSKAFGEFIEIWDVRRAWIAKWTVEGSASEGGVSDMVFSDSHALWATHPSGTFSQMDLRFAEKPIESVPRVALCWDSANSFVHVTDSPKEWEIPYDDIDVTAGNVYDEKMLKSRGDPQYFPDNQAIGSSSLSATHGEKLSFAILAESYRIEGSSSRSDICGKNAAVAFNVYRPDAGNVWLLLQSLLMDVPIAQPKMQARLNYKQTISGFQSSSSRISQSRTVSERPLPPGFYAEKKLNDKELQTLPDDTDLSSSQSNIIPSQDITRSTSKSIQSLRYSSEFKTHQFSSLPYSNVTINSDSGISNKPGPRSRDFGDIMQDGSDSSDGGQNGAGQGPRPYKSLQGSGCLSLSQSAPHYTVSAGGNVQRKYDDRRWSNRELNISMSPNSSDEEFNELADTPVSPTRDFSEGLKSRKESGDALFMHQSLSRRQSNSSMRTVTAENNLVPSETSINRFQIGKQVIGSQRTSRVHSPVSRDRAHNLTDSSNESQRKKVSRGADSASMQVTAFGIADISFYKNSSVSNRDDGEYYLEDGWQELRKELQKFIHNGDLQMSAMLSCIASKELRLTRWETTRLVEAYIEQLCQLRLYVAAAYLRKYYTSHEIFQATQIQTTLHTVCSKCHMSTPKKSSQKSNNIARSFGGYLCSKCRTPLVKCSICHLPVRTLLFVCPVCAHGGHQDCYRLYYMKRPMTRLTTIPAVRGRKTAKEMSSPGAVDIDTGVSTTLAGHPCAAGCGHFCWAASEVSIL